MPDPVKITEQDLRSAMRDPRYWRSGQPEREAFSGWVTRGWQGLYPRDSDARSAVWVQAYVRDGHQVAAHWRGAPPRHGGSAASDDGNRGEGDAGRDADPSVSLANWWSRFGRGPVRAPDRGSSGPSKPGPAPRQRRADGGGNDNVQDLRSDPTSRWDRRLRGDIDQWDRPGGEAGRSRDLQQLRPRGMPDDLGDGVTLHRLEDGRQAVLRPSTSPGSNGVATLEIQEPFRGGFTATDKFRYPVGR